MTSPSRTFERSFIEWESVKFDGSANRTAQAIDLGTTGDGRWLFVGKGTTVTRPGDRSYNHPCDAIALIPPSALWTATWLVDWDPSLYVDVAKLVSVDPQRIVTMDLDVDVVRRRDGEIEVRDLDEFRTHSRQMSYPPDLVDSVGRTADELEAALRHHRKPFFLTPDAPPLPFSQRSP